MGLGPSIRKFLENKILLGYSSDYIGGMFSKII
jgi:hypothetical protein